METIQVLIEFISILKEISFFVLDKFIPEAKRKKIKQIMIESFVITSTIVLFAFLIRLLEFETIKMFNENFLILYGLVFIGVWLAKFISSWIIKLFPFNGKDLNNFLRVLTLAILIIVLSIIVSMVNRINIGGVKVKFTEDVLAQFVVKDGLVYDVKVPKDTIVFLNSDDINKIDYALPNGNEDLKLFLSQNVENVILLKKSQIIPLEENKELYFVEKRNILNSTIPKNEGNYNIDSINEQLCTINFLPETKLRLTKDKDVVLLEDTKVEIYERKYKYLVSGLLILISILTPLYVIVTYINRRNEKRKIIRVLLKRIQEIKNMK